MSSARTWRLNTARPRIKSIGWRSWRLNWFADRSPIQLLAVVHGRIGHRIMPDQLVLGVRVHMVLVAEEAAAMLLGPARIAVLLPQLGGLLLPPRRCAPSLQLVVL